MKKLPNIVFLILGVILIWLVFHFMINGILGWFLTTTGVILIGVSIFRGSNPFKVIFEFIANLL